MHDAPVVMRERIMRERMPLDRFSLGLCLEALCRVVLVKHLPPPTVALLRHWCQGPHPARSPLNGAHCSLVFVPTAPYPRSEILFTVFCVPYVSVFSGDRYGYV